MSDASRIVLAVDDASDDLQLMRLAVASSDARCEFKTASGGVEALAYLNGDGRFADRREYPLPDLIFLDIQMPGCDGFCVLERLRSRTDELKRVPVVMLTTSHDLSDVRRAYDLGANSFLVKPTGFGELAAMMKSTLAYWLPYNRSARFQ